MALAATFAAAVTSPPAQRRPRTLFGEFLLSRRYRRPVCLSSLYFCNNSFIFAPIALISAHCDQRPTFSEYAQFFQPPATSTSPLQIAFKLDILTHHMSVFSYTDFDPILCTRNGDTRLLFGELILIRSRALRRSAEAS